MVIMLPHPAWPFPVITTTERRDAGAAGPRVCAGKLKFLSCPPGGPPPGMAGHGGRGGGQVSHELTISTNSAEYVSKHVDVLG